jgi:hypothetical protein
MSLVLCLWAVGAHAETPIPKCLPTKLLKETLLEEYQETVMWRGITNTGTGLIEIYANAEGSTFTVVITARVSGEDQSCMLGAGTDWMSYKPESKGDPL